MSNARLSEVFMQPGQALHLKDVNVYYLFNEHVLDLVLFLGCG